jgi:hypothetical protein
VDHSILHSSSPTDNLESAETSQCTPASGGLGTERVHQVSSDLGTQDRPATNWTNASEICTSNLTAWRTGESGVNEGGLSGSHNVGAAFQDSARVSAQVDQERTHFNPTTSDEFFSLFPSSHLANSEAQVEQERTHFNPATSDEFFSLFPNPQLANPMAHFDIELAQINSSGSEALYSPNVSSR